MKKKIFFVAAVFISSQVTAQQQDSTRFKKLNEVTVIGTRTEKKLGDVSKSVTVFTAKDFDDQQYQNVADLLSKAEGIYVNGTMQNPGALQYLYLRGADARQTLIMIDGVKLSDAATPDNSFDLSELSLANVERIEIVRGSQGTLYGSSAIGGTINIITKKNNKPGFRTNVKTQNGTFGKKTFSSNNSVGVGYKAPSGIYFNADYFNSINNGFNATIDNGTNAFGFKGDERDNFFKHDIAVKAGFNNGDWDVYAGYRRAHQKNDIDDGAYQDDENRVIDFNRNLITYGIGKKLSSSFSINFYGGYTNTERRDDDDSSLVETTPITYDAATGHSKFIGKYLSNEAQLNWKKNNFNLVAGAGNTNEKMTVNQSFYFRNYNFTSESNYDTLGIKTSTSFVYARGELKIPTVGDRYFNIGGGFRFSDNKQFGDFLSFEINPSVKTSDNTIVFANYSKGFNAPSLYQQFAPESDFSSGITRGNKNLKPEESYTAEFGVRSLIENVLALNFSIYHSEVKNYIEYVYLWNSGKPTGSLDFNDYRGDTYLNLGKLISTGFEIGSTVEFSKRFEMNANASVNVGKLRYSPSNVNATKTAGNHVQIFNTGAFLTEEKEQRELNRRPTSTFNFNLTYKPSAWRFTLDVRSIGSRPDVVYDYTLGPFGALARTPVKSFIVTDLGANWNISKALITGFQLTNIFNENYSEINGFQTRGRGAWVTLRVSL